MRNDWYYRHPARLAGMAVLACWLAACVALRQDVAIAPPANAGADFVGSGSCGDCHADISRLFPESPHGRAHATGVGGEAATGCESCHGPASLHVAVPGRNGRIAAGDRANDSCVNCHLHTAAAFRLPHHHPTVNGSLTCTSCHDPHGRSAVRTAGQSGIARQNEGCASCHQRQATVHVYGHEALQEGCVSCHEPHGSVYSGLLRAPGANLCLRCHAQVADPALGVGELAIGKRWQHTIDVRGSTCWTAGCHTAVHGSNANAKLLY